MLMARQIERSHLAAQHDARPAEIVINPTTTIRALRLRGEPLCKPRGFRIALLDDGKVNQGLQEVGFDCRIIDAVLIAEVDDLADAEFAAPQLLAEVDEILNANG